MKEASWRYVYVQYTINLVSDSKSRRMCCASKKNGG